MQNFIVSGFFKMDNVHVKLFPFSFSLCLSHCDCNTKKKKKKKHIRNGPRHNAKWQRKKSIEMKEKNLAENADDDDIFRMV